VIFSTINDSWEIVESIVEKWGFSPSGCTLHTMNCNFATHAPCPLALTTYKYSELQMVSAIHATCPLAFTLYKYSKLQMSFTIQKLNCKASRKTPFFHSLILLRLNLKRYYNIQTFYVNNNKDWYTKVKHEFACMLNFPFHYWFMIW
jgi:hypothetical protein